MNLHFLEYFLHAVKLMFLWEWESLVLGNLGHLMQFHNLTQEFKVFLNDFSRLKIACNKNDASYHYKSKAPQKTLYFRGRYKKNATNQQI